MRCEIVAVGTELLLGQVVDTNSSWIGEHLALAGIDSHFQTKVGDNPDRMRAALEQALERSDAVIMCGGLGPTQDDITRDVIADVMGVELVRDEEIVERIRAMFGSRGRQMTDNNLRQADIPVGASTIPQMPGTAAGLICPIGDKVVYAVPGVPYEMEMMVTGTVIPDLQHRAGISAVIASRTLRTWGHSESGLAEMLAPRIDELDDVGNPTLAFLASGVEGLKVRITAKAGDDAEVAAILDAEEKLLRGILGDLVFGVDDQTMESVVLDELRARSMTLAVAEAITGGFLAERLTAVEGATDVLRGALIADTGVARELTRPQGRRPTEGILEPGDPYDPAGELARGVRQLFSADVGLATAGGEPAGTVNLAIALGDEVESLPIRLPGDRLRIRQFATISVLNLLRQRLQQM